MTQSVAPSSRRWPVVVLSLSLVAVFVALVWPALHGPFVFDDLPNLAALASPGGIHSWHDIAIYLSQARSFPGRPLAMLSFLPQQGDWPGNPFPFKLVNLVLHLVNSGLLFVLARQLLAGVRPNWSRSWVLGIAAASSIAWLVHPMQLSTVMLVVQRMTLMTTLFLLLGLVAYVNGVTAKSASPKMRALWMIGGIVVAGLFAVLSKESGALLPLYALAIDATLLRSQVLALPRGLRLLRRLLLYPAIALIAVMLLSLMHDPLSTIAGRDFSIVERLMTEPRVLFDYAYKILVPRYTSYGLYHDDFLVSRGLLSPWTTLPSLLLVTVTVATAFLARKRLPLLAFAIAWFLGGHVMESGPVALEIYFEHRNYLPMFGPLLAAFTAVASLPAGLLKRALTAASVLWLLACLFATALYANVWSSQEKLSYFWADAHPGSVRARGDYAAYLFEKGMLDGSLQILKQLQQQQPQEIGVDMNIAYVTCINGSITPANVDQLRYRISNASWSRLGFEGLGQLRELVSAGRCGTAINGKKWLQLSDAMLANPSFRNENIAMGRLHYQRHELARADGDLALALHELDETAKYEDDPDITRLKAKYLADAGLYDEALSQLKSYDPSRRRLLRRLLVDDVALNQTMANDIRRKRDAKASDATLAPK